ncbi:undecaprenyl-diphosphatase UppP [Alkalicoccobacillus plakortidis]|uniref:Undecaprenyl-diphosphatase n=1 Tax=Alkalicoccobacillus plakortidis TaxID=444060 RepID=A0ABT0XE99_9BACI|nr:undecaprenyl-diphosphatase UppP [Alkalicoccobacillus plakortidis]MCM2674207.1 undecaprenyl-diphosphatase UppP [Alkalicoccobacillus plakortidis]
MTLIEALVLGLVQGLTEFLPISSSAHLVITQMLFNISFPGFGFEILLHLGSVLAVIIYYRKDLIELIIGFFSYIKNRSEENKTNFWFSIYILVATIITGVSGILFEDYISTALKGPTMIAISLTITGIFLIIIERAVRTGGRTEKDMTLFDSVIIGIGQSLALIPGLSRSGTTLVVGMFAGLTKETAVRYSFLLSIPVILGSTVLAIKDLLNGELLAVAGAFPLIVAFIVTFISSLLGIVWFINFLKKSKLIYFAIYCFVLALFVFIFLGDVDPDLF